MNHYLLDTNLLVYSLRNDRRWDIVCQSYAIEDNNNFISVVSLGELWSLAFRNEWGQNGIEKLERLNQSFIIADINIESIIRRYAEIDAFSQGKLKGMQLELSARNMGKKRPVDCGYGICLEPDTIDYRPGFRPFIAFFFEFTGDLKNRATFVL